MLYKMRSLNFMKKILSLREGIDKNYDSYKV